MVLGFTLTSIFNMYTFLLLERFEPPLLEQQSRSFHNADAFMLAEKHRESSYVRLSFATVRRIEKGSPKEYNDKKSQLYTPPLVFSKSEGSAPTPIIIGIAGTASLNA